MSTSNPVADFVTSKGLVPLDQPNFPNAIKNGLSVKFSFHDLVDNFKKLKRGFWAAPHLDALEQFLRGLVQCGADLREWSSSCNDILPSERTDPVAEAHFAVKTAVLLHDEFMVDIHAVCKSRWIAGMDQPPSWTIEVTMHPYEEEPSRANELSSHVFSAYHVTTMHDIINSLVEKLQVSFSR